MNGAQGPTNVRSTGVQQAANRPSAPHRRPLRVFGEALPGPAGIKPSKLFVSLQAMDRSRHAVMNLASPSLLALDASARPLPQDQAGRVALITGANTGIGRVTAVKLARRGARVFLACRDAQRTQPVLDEIAALPGALPATWLPLDLGDFQSVRQCADAFLAHDLPLHLLINNAGVAGGHGLTRSGFELAFGINHMGHFLLTQLLLPRLRGSAPARVVTVASRAHRRVATLPPLEQLRQPTRTRLGVAEYGASKLANILFSAELARQLAGSGVSAYALHPGVVASEIWRVLPTPLRWLLHLRPMLNTEEGARTSLYCATDPSLAKHSGLYYSDGLPVTPSAAAQDEKLARSLWHWSASWVQD